ncbi:MAG: MarR family transcriptional regulator [Flavobacteriales bacterium]|jgi:MarR family transcriptional regulator, 2-MHQ and catechol-resistance regulon repressor|nr:MarR family transcriptional regulator [Flavobacteriales bacterium]MBK9513182.1 MarR family transcriptional regulator [Flavobacteriales bacterium]MBP7448874.1 MarR family transcriptional regulator [Flavobacteriales bacterium]HOZ39484.1 MarR family transcriptional regulator [Flavobacteriales bacterium]
MARIEEELLSKFESEQQKAMLNVLFTANWLRSRQTAVYKPFGISPQQYNILRILRGAKGRMNMNSVKERMIDRAPNATRLTDKLIAKGLVERERCEEDRRVVYVRISPKGLELLARIDVVNRSDMKDLIERVSEAEAEWTNRALDHMRG